MTPTDGRAPAHPAIEPTAAELVAEVQRVRERRYVEQNEAVRSPSGILGLVVLSVIFAALSAWDPVAKVLGVSWRAVAVAMVPQIAIMVAATWAAKRHGIMSRAHRTLEQVESAVTTAVGAGLIWTARDASVPLWFIPAAQVAFALSHDLHKRLERALLLGAYVLLLPLAFAWSGDRASAGLALFIGATLWLVQHTRFAALAQSAGDLARANLLQKRMEQLLLSEERARIARDLHDGLGAELAALLWQVQAFERDDRDRARDEVLARLRGSIDELRRVVADLKHPDASLDALARALELRGRELCGERAELVVHASGEGRIAGQVCGQLDMIVREAIRNALQHGRAQRIELEISASDALIVELRDDGVGIADGAAQGSQGGLAHLRQRAAAMGGELEIGALTHGTRGTRVRIHLKAGAWRRERTQPPRPMAMG